jgi:helix-turn-helix protein
LIRALAAQTHPGPFGAPVRVSRASLDRWIRAYRAGGFAALVPAPRWLATQTPREVLELAVALKTEAPGRTAAQVAVVLAAHAGWVPSPRTLQRHFAALGLNRWRPGGTPPAVFGRFEADQPNARWVGDALHGPHVAGREAILIALLDDHSRAVVAARWGHAETAVALRETLRVALVTRGAGDQAQEVLIHRAACHCRGTGTGTGWPPGVDSRHLSTGGQPEYGGGTWARAPGPTTGTSRTAPAWAGTRAGRVPGVADDDTGPRA